MKRFIKIMLLSLGMVFGLSPVASAVSEIPSGQMSVRQESCITAKPDNVFRGIAEGCIPSVSLMGQAQKILAPETKAEEGSIDYSHFVFVCGSNVMVYHNLQPTEVKDRYVTRVPLSTYTSFYLYNPYNNNEGYLQYTGNVSVTPDASVDLQYWNRDMESDVYYTRCEGFNGIYDVTLDFEGEDVHVSFEYVEELIFDPATVRLVNPNSRSTITPSEYTSNTAVYKNLGFSRYTSTYLYLTDPRTSKLYGGLDNNPTIGENNLTTNLYSSELSSTSQVYFMEVYGLEGVYDMSVTYNNDFTIASLSFEKQTYPDAVTSYDGDMYIIGEGNGWTCGDPAYKMICVYPGVYEWSGESLSTGFKFNGGAWNMFFPGTDYPIDLGGYNSFYTPYLIPDYPYGLQFRGDDIFFTNGLEVVKNAKVRLNLLDMTVSVTGKPEVNIQNLSLHTEVEGVNSTLSSNYWPIVNEDNRNEIVYKDIPFEATTFSLQSHDGSDAFFGWKEQENALSDEFEQNNIVTTLYLDAHNFVKTNLFGVYDVYVTLNEDKTEAIVKLDKTKDLPFVNVSVDNGISFRFRSINNKKELIRVSTDDDYWGISGYSENGADEIVLETPVTTYSHMFTVPEEGNLNILFHTEYLGECLILGGTVGDDVVFENKVTITRSEDGVIIKGTEQGEEIAVYSLGGQLVSLAKAQADEITITLEKGQSYIVRVGQVAAKVLM